MALLSFFLLFVSFFNSCGQNYELCLLTMALREVSKRDNFPTESCQLCLQNSSIFQCSLSRKEMTQSHQFNLFN